MTRNRTIVCNLSAGITTLLFVAAVEFLIKPAAFFAPTQSIAKPAAILAERSAQVVDPPVLPRPAPIKQAARPSVPRTPAPSPWLSAVRR